MPAGTVSGKLVNHPALTCRKQRGNSQWGEAVELQSSLLPSRLSLLNAPYPSQIMPPVGDPVFKHSRLCGKHFIFRTTIATTYLISKPEYWSSCKTVSMESRVIPDRWRAIVTLLKEFLIHSVDTVCSTRAQ